MANNKFFECLNVHLSRIRLPTANDKIYKDECIYSFDCPVCVHWFYFTFWCIEVI